ncbi:MULTISPECIES: PH domain-containing protein [Nocardioides]|uniref:PH domain-containing protein n=1 Tax=Nocardioides vastitatis TaxID=2568655 RepID=A0ABW0ZK24_9ACTN|nr:PH domain-containing protein [Nocardioides sp.]THI99423.1 PH domain-containing protein [Nocardioides sp.]
MPAGSELPELPQTYRPFGPRMAAMVFGALLVGAFAWLWMTFDQQTKDSVGFLQKATVIGFVLLGLALLNALARSRVVATAQGLTVVNGYRTRSYEWAEVIALRMPVGAPWPSLDISDGTTVPVMGIHASDGARAKHAVLALKALVAARSG